MVIKLICGNVLKSYSNILACKAFPRFVSSRNLSSSNCRDEKIKLDDKTTRQLETLSLVNFESKKHIEVVEEAIKFADQIQSVNTDHVEPLTSVLEIENLKLRDDVISEGNCRKEILLNAAQVEEDYFIAPPGNIPVNLDSSHTSSFPSNHEQPSDQTVTDYENFQYLKPIFSDLIVSHFKYGPLGELLRQNIHHEWTFSCLVNRDVNVYPFCSVDSESDLLTGIYNHYCEAKEINGSYLPFSIIFSQLPINQKVGDALSSDESKYFRTQKVSAMKCFTFTTPEEGPRFFHYWLRQRKIWWRKFSANPTRFSLSNINKIPEKMEFANIQAEFPWGVEPVEEVRLYSKNIFEKLPDIKQNAWLIKKGKSKVFPAIVESVTNSDLACFTFLCDAFVEDLRLDTGLPHQVIRLHRKLAPYKAAVLVDFVENNDQKEDLLHLAEYVSLTLKKNAVPTLFLSSKRTKTNEEWFQYYDLLAVPFVVVLQPSTLNDGIFGIRSRETTLQERLHIAKLPEYMTQLLKNY